MSAYLFALIHEIAYNIIKQNKDRHGLTFFSHLFLNKAYADNTIILQKGKESVREVINAFDTFSIYSDLKANKS